MDLAPRTPGAGVAGMELVSRTPGAGVATTDFASLRRHVEASNERSGDSIRTMVADPKPQTALPAYLA